MTATAEQVNDNGSLTWELPVLSCMTDMRQQMHLSWLFRLFQEISIQHTIELGIDRSKTLDRGLLWVISRQTVSIHRLPSYDETIRLTTWPGKTLEILFPRYYRLEAVRGSGTITGRSPGAVDREKAGEDSESELLAEGEAFWLLMNQNTRSFAFPEENGIVIPKSSLAPDEQPFPRPLRCPKDIALSPALNWNPGFSQIDLNGHVNNANYYDVLDDLQAQKLSLPHHIEAEYRSEIRPGTDVSIFEGINSKNTIRFFEGYPAANTEHDSSSSDLSRRQPLFRIMLQYN